MSMDNKMMFLVSILAGLFVTMNTWAYKFDHIRLLYMNDVYMIVLMAVLMVFISMIFMNSAHAPTDTKTWVIWIIVIIVLFIMIRRQVFVDDAQYLNGMIPHHSMAILMSEKIKEKTKNPKIIKLANQIIESQVKEIDQMNDILNENN